MRGVRSGSGQTGLGQRTTESDLEEKEVGVGRR